MTWEELSLLTEQYIFPGVTWVFHQLPCDRKLPILITYGMMIIMNIRAMYQQRVWASEEGPWCLVTLSLAVLYILPLLVCEWSPWTYNWINLLGVWRLIILLAVEPPTSLRLEPFNFNSKAFSAMVAYLVNLFLLLNAPIYLPQSAIPLWHTTVWIIYIFLLILHQRGVTQHTDLSIGEDKDVVKMA